MGCIFSRGSGGECRGPNGGSKEVATPAGGAVAGTTANNDPNAVTDQRIPLTVRQKFSISKSWKGESNLDTCKQAQFYKRLSLHVPDVLVSHFIFILCAFLLHCINLISVRSMRVNVVVFSSYNVRCCEGNHLSFCCYFPVKVFPCHWVSHTSLLFHFHSW